MGNAVIADASVLVALINTHDPDHKWAVALAEEWGAPWFTCESVLSETFFVIGANGREDLWGLLHRGLLIVRFNLENDLKPVLALMEKYADVPMSLADACIVRMTEILPNPVVLTTDPDFRVYRRHGRQVVPCRMP